MRASRISNYKAKDKIRVVILITVMMLFVIAKLYSQNNNTKFEKIGIEQGLSQTSINTIFQDSKGFMWFGTLDGLNKYDGYGFTVYRHDPQNGQSLSHANVYAIHEDHAGFLWIGTSGGLNKFNRDSETFYSYKHDRNNPKSISSDRILSIYEDHSGNLWIATNGGGLNKFDPVKETFTRYQHNPDDAQSLSHNVVKPIFEDTFGALWIGTAGGGLNKFDPVQEIFKHYKYNPDNPESLSNNIVYSIHEDRSGVLWIGTNNGLDQFDRTTETFKHYKHDANNPQSLSDNRIRALYEDQSGTLWVGTYDGGLSLLTPANRETGHFFHYRHNPNEPRSLSDNTVTSFYQDRSGLIWIGTDFGGINKFNQAGGAFTHFKHEPGKPLSLSDNMIQAMHEDRSGSLWVGTEIGLNKYDPKTETITHYKYDSDNPSGLSDSSVSSVLEDRSGTLWIGTSSGGLNKFDKKKGTFIHYKHDPSKPSSLSSGEVGVIFEDRLGMLWIGTTNGLNQFDSTKETFVRYKNDPENEQSLSDHNIRSIYEDKSGTLWIGTYGGGLNKFLPAKNDMQKGSFIRFQHSPDNPKGLSHNSIWSIHEDHSGILWIGTNYGLNRFDRANSQFKHYLENDGLLNDVIYALLEDDHGNIWMSTNKGLSKFNPRLETFKNYEVRDGLQSNEFNLNASDKSASGKMYFGGINGFNVFHPDSIKDNQYIPPVVITSFKKFDEIIENDISSTIQKELSHQDKYLTFEFAALDFTNSEINQYAYKMEGFDKDWIYAGTRRFASYTNLDPGTYTFNVKGSNNDGVWNEAGTSVRIIISPPWWKTLWAYSIYTLLLAGSIFGYNRYRTRAHTKELARERRVTDKLRKVDKLKDNFLANTSHELRTPLHGIIGITESLLDDVDGEPIPNIQSNLSMVVASGKRLANLVNNILDFSKLKTHDLELRRKPINIGILVNMVLKFNQPLLSSKRLKLKNDIPKNVAPINGDENRLQQILYNLIGNAIKFTETGSITISAVEKQSMLEVSISDTGIGIPNDKFEAIFQSFEQVDASVIREYGGTGLGLSITKQLVELHGGKIWVESKVNEGSVFTFTLPCSNDKPQHLPSDIPDQVRIQSVEPIEFTLEKKPEAGPNGNIHILVVEDEPVNQQVLVNHLSSANYRVIQAFNGLEALNIIKSEKKIDLILLDIMMPRMSGYEVCQKIREKYLPSELPVIMITAKEQVSDLVEGFSVGANDYLAKPISKNELLARIKTHLNLYNISSAYGRFVPREFLQSLGHESILEVKLGDQARAEMTILFSDIRRYSTLSESMTPKENFNFLNAYLKRVGPVIVKHKGFVNQYYGDGVMALFSGKVSDAINAAIEMQKVVADYNCERRKKGRIEVEIGVGLHTGSLIMGILGDEHRMNAGVVSDAVNTASRMEGLTKFYGAPIIMSEDTLSLIEDSSAYNHRFLGKVRAKGKLKELSVFEITDGNLDKIIELKIKTRSDFESGLSCYFIKDFTSASVSFKKVLNVNPNDRTAKLYLKRCAQLMVQGVPKEWEGVEIMGSTF